MCTKCMRAVLFLVLMARMECLEEYFLFIYNHFYGGTLC